MLELLGWKNAIQSGREIISAPTTDSCRRSLG